MRPLRDVVLGENGTPAYASTLSYAVDLFGSIGAMRGKDCTQAFSKVFADSPDIALRLALWARDVRGGAGERQHFRDILLWLEKNACEYLLGSNFLKLIPEVGRFDDLLVFEGKDTKYAAFRIIAQALQAGNSLAAKWMPRQGPKAIELRKAFGLSAREWRKGLVSLTNVVETQMCDRNWNEIKFDHVPSQAMKKYFRAFQRNAPDAFAGFLEKAEQGEVEVNAGAIYPHQIIEMLYSGDRLAEQMWKNLPNYIGSGSILCMADTSGSMYGTPLNVAIALAMYCAEKNENPAFKDFFMTFSESPEFIHLQGTLAERLLTARSSNWGMNTDLDKALKLLLDTAVNNVVPQSDMPKALVILSDMQFDECASLTGLEMITRNYSSMGYQMPKIIFWNLRDVGNKPVRFNQQGVALISGFSPAIMKSVLSVKGLEDFTPENIMLKTLGNDRYSWQ